MSYSDIEIILSYPFRTYNNIQYIKVVAKGDLYMELDYQAIGIRIRRFRKEHGLTQQTLAELSNQEPSNISHIERGATKLSLPTIVNIANALNITVDALLCDSLSSAKVPFVESASSILSDCTHQELIIITDTMRTLKDNLRRVGI